MTGFRQYLVATVAFLAPIASANAAEGLYAGVGAGVDFMPDRGLDITAGSFNLPVTSQWKTGYAVQASFGYAWDFGLRTEVEYSFREQKISSFTSNGISSPWIGSQWDNSLMANALYDIPTGTALSPFIGFGIGGAHISWGDNFRPAGTSIIYDASDTRFAWQGIAGLDYAVTPRLTVDVDFRIKGSDGYAFPAVQGVVARNFDYMTRTVVFGIRYGFGP